MCRGLVGVVARVLIKLAVHVQGDTNAQSLTHIEDEVQQELFDMIVHVGDFACACCTCVGGGPCTTLLYTALTRLSSRWRF